MRDLDSMHEVQLTLSTLFRRGWLPLQTRRGHVSTGPHTTHRDYS